MASADQNQCYGQIDGELAKLRRALAGDTAAMREVLSSFARPVYFYILHLTHCGPDKAYETAVQVLSSRLLSDSGENSRGFLADCLRAAYKTASTLPARASFAAGDASGLFLKEALGRLSIEEKAFLLLRDMLCLPYALIGAVHELPERDARVRVERARLALRESLEQILRRKEGLR